jgi:hypothetical protein
MDQQFTTVETCDCKDNEQEERRILEIHFGRGPKELLVAELRPNVRIGPETVTQGQVTTQFGRSFDDLLGLGPGLHSICHRRTIGPKDSVFKPRREE